jgi:hypothetical protein
MIAELEHLMERYLRRFRLGWYISQTKNGGDDFGRVSATAEWGPNQSKVRRIASPILDVIPAIGTRVAVMAQDGVPAFPAWIGQVWDDLGTPAQMTAWLRAQLSEHPGQVELGATEGVRIHVGTNNVEIDPVGAGHIVIGNGTVDLVDVCHRLIAALRTANAGGFPLDPATLATLTILEAELGQIKD